MAIEKYVTKCIVIESFDNGEHDRVYKLFTREFGLVLAKATSVRKLESKLRSHVTLRSLSTVTLVQGRETWRLVGAEGNASRVDFIHEVAELVKRFIRGEGAHVSLYDRIVMLVTRQDEYDEQKRRLLLYYILLLELGYADVKVIGAKDMNEYHSWSLDDIYTHLILSYPSVKSHILTVLKEVQL